MPAACPHGCTHPSGFDALKVILRSPLRRGRARKRHLIRHPLRMNSAAATRDSLDMGQLELRTVCAGSAWHGGAPPSSTSRRRHDTRAGVRNPGHDRFRHVTTDAQGPAGVCAGFTIGGTREMRAPATSPRPATSRRASGLHHGGGVHRTVGLGRGAGRACRGGACSCGKADCPAPGARPLDPAAVVPAGATLDEVTESAGRFPRRRGAARGPRLRHRPTSRPADGRRALTRLGAHGAAAGPGRRHEGRAHCFVARRCRRGSPPCSTAWAGTTRPSTCTRAGRRRAYHGPALGTARA